MKLEKLAFVHCDNAGSLFMGNYEKQSVRTKHIDMRYHFIRKYVLDGMVEIIFVPSEEHNWGIFIFNEVKGSLVLPFLVFSNS